MIAFLDTSILLKLYHTEEKSGEIQQYLSENISAIYLAELAKIEFRSALWRKVRTQDISSEECHGAIQLFVRDYDLYNWVCVTSEIYNSAADLLMQFGADGLRTLDSIQLASALTLSEKDCIYFTADTILNALFMKLDLRIY